MSPKALRVPPVRARVRFGWVSKKYWYVLARVTVVAIPCRRVLIVLEQGMPNNGTKQISHDIIQEVISRDQNASLISTASLDTCLPPLPCPTVPLSFSHSPSSLLSARNDIGGQADSSGISLPKTASSKHTSLFCCMSHMVPRERRGTRRRYR